MKTLSKEAENKILEAIQDICEYVNDGMHPTAATIKVAEEHSLTPNFIQLACTGYNTGATTFQREKAAGILEKMAEFPLVDTSAVLAHLYPSKPVTSGVLKEASAVSSEYSKAPKSNKLNPLKVAYAEKIASTKLPMNHKATALTDPNSRMKRAYNQSIALKRSLANKRAQYAGAQDDLLSKLGQVADTVRRSGVDIGSWEAAAVARNGAAGKAVFDYVYAKCSNSKRANTAGRTLVDWSQPLGRLIDNAIKSARDVVSIAAEYRALEADTEQKVAALLAPHLADEQPVVIETKKADILSGLGGAMLAGGNQATGLGKSPTALAQGYADELDDPAHDNELRQIRARAMLQDLMMNDEVISGYDPGEVMDAYNEISSVTPRSSTQSAIIRPLLRKRLTQGAIEPFEAAEMVNIEKGLGQAQKSFSPTNNPLAKEGAANVLQHRILV